MKAIIRYVVCVCFILAFWTTAHAQEEYIGPQAGDFSISPALSFNYTMPDEFDDQQDLILLTSIGYFLSENLELGGVIMGMAGGESLTDVWAVYVAPYASYHFYLEQSPRLSPFIGVGCGGAHLDIDQDEYDEFFAGCFAGLDYFIKPTTALRIEARYDELIGGDYEASMVQFFIGLNIIF